MVEKEPFPRNADLFDVVILFLMMHYVCWLEYPVQCRYVCKLSIVNLCGTVGRRHHAVSCSGAL